MTTGQQQPGMAGEKQLAELLTKARAVPVEQRDSETAAFIEGEQLEQEARAALPLPKAGGRAPPPRGPTAAVDRRRTLTAYLKCARADWLCPGPPPSRLATNRHLLAHLDGLWPFKLEGQAADSADANSTGSSTSAASGGGSAKGGRRARQQQKAAALEPPAASEAVQDARSSPGGPLARALQLYFAAPVLMPRPEAFEAARDAAAILADPVCLPQVEAALAELEALASLGAEPAPDGQPAPAALLTAAQLRWLCTYATVSAGVSLLALQEGGFKGATQRASLPEAEQRAMLEQSRAAAKALTALQPAEPLSWIAAADVGGVTNPDTLEQYMKALELARAQQRPFYVARAGDQCLTAAVGFASGFGGGASGLPPDAIVAALAAHAEAVQALRLCKPLLPQAWTATLALSLENSAPLADLLTQQLSQGGTVDVPAVLEALRSAAANLPAPEGTMRCCHCGQPSAQLKRCGRCKAREAQYCSIDCQRAAWRTHKAECSPA